jgi:hypothetical protein
MAKARKISDESIDQTHLSRSMKMMLASLHLENITLSPESIADLQLVEAGTLSQKEAIARVLARVKK